MTDQRLLYSPEGAAEVLSLGRSKVFELMADGQLSSVRIGKSRRIPRGALLAYVQRLQRESRQITESSTL